MGREQRTGFRATGRGGWVHPRYAFAWKNAGLRPHLKAVHPALVTEVAFVLRIEQPSRARPLDDHVGPQPTLRIVSAAWIVPTPCQVVLRHHPPACLAGQFTEDSP